MDSPTIPPLAVSVAEACRMMSIGATSLCKLIG